MGSLNSIPLCSRGRVADVDGNNNLPDHPNREQHNGVVEVQPDATSTPKLRRIEPLPERDLGESSNSDSLESEFELRAEDQTFGSDSGLDPSGDELDTTIRSSVDETEQPEVDDPETIESLRNGDLGVDKVISFKTTKEESENANEEPTFEYDPKEEERKEKERAEIEARVALKVESLGGDTEAAITSLLTDLVVTGGGESER